MADVNLNAGTGPARGVAIREFPLLPGHGFADYLLYVKGKACAIQTSQTSHHGSGKKTARLRTMRRTGRFPIFLFLRS